jgi:Tol biopolymer transport system component
MISPKTLLLSLILILLNFHCITDALDDPIKVPYTLEGFVTDKETGVAVESVFVQAISYSPKENNPPFTYTNAQGFYSIIIVNGAQIDMIRYEKKGYFTKNIGLTNITNSEDNGFIKMNTELIPAGECPHKIGIDPDPPINCYVWSSLYPSWSPDGRYIAYIAGDEHREIHGLYVYDIAKRREKRILDWADNMSSQAWSLDGRWITFSMGAQIYKIRRDGSNLTRLTNDLKRQYFNSVWSPDGRWIAYEDRTPIPSDESNRPDSVLKRGTWIMNPDGNNKQWLIRYAYHNTWNPKNSSLILSVISLGAFVDDRFLIWSPHKTNKDTLFIMDRTINNNPHYAPDASRIVFHMQYGEFDVWIINSDGTGLQRLTSNGGAFPAWSPDGSAIAYVNIDYFDGNGQIYLMNPQGMNKRPMRR